MLTLYVHYDMVSHQTLVKGLPLHNVLLEHEVLLPQKIMLLEKVRNIGVIDPYTKFTILDSVEATKSFLQDVASKKIHPVSWIDYQSRELLEQLTPLEISEILYMNHVGQPYRSPFFYKLQNNWTLLVLADDCYKIYQRQPEEFNSLVNEYVVSEVRRLVRRPWPFTFTEEEIPLMSREVFSQFADLFREGVLLDFNKLTADKSKVTVPIFFTEDFQQLSHDRDPEFFLQYDRQRLTWTVEEIRSPY